MFAAGESLLIGSSRKKKVNLYNCFFRSPNGAMINDLNVQYSSSNPKDSSIIMKRIKLPVFLLLMGGFWLGRRFQPLTKHPCETALHMHWEWLQWPDRYAKNRLLISMLKFSVQSSAFDFYF